MWFLLVISCSEYGKYGTNTSDDFSEKLFRVFYVGSADQNGFLAPLSKIIPFL